MYMMILNHIVRMKIYFFINAWNEWAEGNHLEPGLKWGRKYLEATKEVIKGESV